MRWLFNDCALDSDRRELRRAGTLVAVEPQVFDLLVHLIENRARVISKDGLLEAVWQGRIVSDSALANRINAARLAVGDSGERQHVIRTLPRKGFRFVGDVVEDGVPTNAALMTNLPEPTRGLSLPDQPSIVVLPFTDMSPQQNEGHFADGITEDLITELSRIRWLFVIARNSAFAYKGRAVDVKQVGRELGVRYILEGSVRRASAFASASSSSMRRRACITGPSVTTATSARCSRCRTRSRAVWPPRSSRTCSPRKAFAPHSARRPISAPGSWSRVRRASSGD